LESWAPTDRQIFAPLVTVRTERCRGGVLDWSTGIYNPRIDITKNTTTLYVSDRDVFLFLVDDLNPIEA